MADRSFFASGEKGPMTSQAAGFETMMDESGKQTSDGVPEASMGLECQSMKKSLVSGFGGYHSAHPDSKNPQPYTTITFEEIEEMAANPDSVPKDQAPWIIPSTTVGQWARVHEYQREKGVFLALWGDADKVEGLNWADVVERTKAALPGFMILVYTSKGAMENKPKSRIIVPLAKGIPGAVYSMIAKILNDRLEAVGLIPDRATERAGQLCYLPNRGEFYRHNIIEGEPLNPSVYFADEIQAETERLKKEAEEREARHQEAMRKTQARINSGQANPVAAFKEAYPVDLALERYGYTRRGKKWLSPRSESGNPGVSVKDGKWFSFHGGDTGIGQPGKEGGCFGDAFDLFVWYEHGGDFNRAVMAAGEMFTTTDPLTGEIVTITKLNQRQYMRELDQTKHEQKSTQKSLTNASEHHQIPEDDRDLLENNSGHDDQLWDFDDAEIHIAKYKDRDLTSSQKLELVRDILENSEFDPLQADLIRDHIKKNLGINKTALTKFEKHQAGGGKDVSDDRTHAELSLDFIKDELPEDPEKHSGCEGSLWVYDEDEGIFRSKSLDDVGTRVGDLYKSAYCKRGSDYDSVAKRIYIRLVDENFFKNASRGLPGNTSFYAVDATGKIVCMEYRADLRQRFKLDCDPDWNCKTTMYSKFLDDCFPNDQNQKELIQEIMGALLTGLAAKLQIAVLLYGFGANGKSVMLGILEGLVSNELKCSVKPDSFSHEYYRAELAGKLINIVGEIDKDKNLTADFKDIVGCDVAVTARPPYERPFRFIPQCGHLFAGNSFPLTKDHSYGFYRRWRLIHFKHIVPENKRIPDLSKKILASETPGVLAWALDGASRLVRNNYKLTNTSENEALIAQWRLAGDSVEAFLNDETLVQMGEFCTCPKRDAYEAYARYCSGSALKPLGVHKFYQRVVGRFQETRDSYGRRAFQGFDVLPTEEPE
jgi:P4 family phage/plasmid primase-like protien